MPGCGKSTAGVLLAKSLKLDFTDTDLLVQSQQNRSLQDIIDSNGMKSFLKAEEKCILSIKASNTVIATGGSVVYSPVAMKHLAAAGTVIYLEIGLSECRKRLADYSGRGVVMPKDMDLEQLFKERIPLYEQYAQFTVDSSVNGHEAVVKNILECLPAR